jgi:Septum formation/Transposase IS116/IS110/IS902 family
MRVIRRWVLSVAVVIAICAVPAFAACGDDGDGGDGNATFEREGFPFTFEYPDSFELREDVTAGETVGGDTSTSTATTSESSSTTETAVGLIPNELRLGDCFNDSAHGTNEVGEITVVDCGSAHDAEVFALATLPGEPGFAPYPGDDEVDRLSNELCLGEFASDVGIDFLDSAWEFSYFLPTEESWRKYDDRLVVCSLNDPSFNKIEGSKPGDINRFPTSGHFARYTGTAPTTASSGPGNGAGSTPAATGN